ncbi:hypothetical protein K490DRAFT_31545 [Saccharata proteae CBS 121410]|uniref:Alpha-acetolactate decarboxylase n=1 Tax=Saccharata proteae CBS 121410 TaxID=1314787 RepID=A0A9P4I3Q0_9PEZI|nr:hypothetical protein K490DRAFT_31545 [Saccharata proteae CBS 121410]
MVASIPNDIFQYSLFSAHSQGFRSGGPPVFNLTSHGDHGIGIFAPTNPQTPNPASGEDGEDAMVMMDAVAYRISSSGGNDAKAEKADPKAVMPFVMVTNFKTSFLDEVKGLTMDILKERFGLVGMQATGGPNSYMPFIVEGEFKRMHLGRKKMGRTLENVNGTIVGFVVPEWASVVSGPRIQACFLSEEETEGVRLGGWVYDFQAVEHESYVMSGKTGRFHLGFPQGGEWEGVKIN